MENNKNSKKVIIFSILALFLIGSISLFYYLKTQIKPDELKATIIQKLEESIPGTEVSLGELKVHFGSSLTVKIKGMDILLKESLVSKRDFLQVSDISVKLPIWSLVTGGGNLEVYLKKPELFLFRPEGKVGNWNIAFNSKEDKDKALTKKGAFAGSHNIILPAFLINSTAALRLSEFKVYYDISGKAGVWSASRLILKNVGLRSNAAFEIESNFKRVVEESEKFSFDTVMIGSIELEKYLKTGKLHINSNYKIKNFKTREHPDVFPLIRGNTSLRVDKTGALEGGVTVLYQESEVDAVFKAARNISEITVNKGRVRLSDIATLLPPWKDNYDLSQANLNFEGRLKSSSDSSLIPTLKFKLANIKYLKRSFPYTFSLSGSLIEKEVKAVFDGSLWGGRLSGSLEGDFDLNSETAVEKRVSFYSADFNFKDNAFPPDLVVPEGLEEGDSRGKNILLPKGIIGVNYENVSFEKIPFSGGFSLKTDQDKVVISNGVILQGEGKASFKSQAKVFKDEISWVHEIIFSKFSPNLISKLIPKEYPFITGVFDGKLAGRFLGHPFRGEDLTWDFSSSSGSFSNFNNSLIFKALSDTAKTTPFSYKLNKKLFGSNNNRSSYLDLNAKIIVKNSEHQIKTLNFKGPKDFSFFISGFVDPTKEKRKRVIVQVEGDKSFQKVLRKKTKLKRLPLALYSKGYELSIDNLYPLRQLAKKFRFKKDRNKMKKEILRVKAESKRNDNEKS